MFTSMPTASKFLKPSSSSGEVVGSGRGDWSKFQPHTSFESFSNANVLLWSVNYVREIHYGVFHYGDTPPSQKHDQIPSPNQSPPPKKKTKKILVPPHKSL